MFTDISILNNLQLAGRSLSQPGRIASRMMQSFCDPFFHCYVRLFPQSGLLHSDIFDQEFWPLWYGSLFSDLFWPLLWALCWVSLFVASLAFQDSIWGISSLSEWSRLGSLFLVVELFLQMKFLILGISLLFKICWETNPEELPLFWLPSSEDSHVWCWQSWSQNVMADGVLWVSAIWRDIK